MIIGFDFRFKFRKRLLTVREPPAQEKWTENTLALVIIICAPVKSGEMLQ